MFASIKANILPAINSMVPPQLHTASNQPASCPTQEHRCLNTDADKIIGQRLPIMSTSKLRHGASIAIEQPNPIRHTPGSTQPINQVLPQRLSMVNMSPQTIHLRGPQEISLQIEPSITATEARRRNALRLVLNEIFSQFVTVRNRTEIEELIDCRLSGLAAMGITPDELKKRLINAESVDNATAIIRGIAGSVGFIAGTQAAGAAAAWALTLFPGPWVPLVPGATIGLIDQAYGGLLTRTKISYHTQPDLDQLAPVMQSCMTSRRRNLVIECAHQAAMLASPFSIRNLIRTLAVLLTGGSNYEATVDTLLDGLGGLPAGGVVERLRISRDRERGLMDPAYVLGSIDWETQLESLQHGVLSKHRTVDVARRVLKKKNELLKMAWDGFMQPFSVGGVAEIWTLASGLVLLDVFKQWTTRVFPHASPMAIAFVKSAVGTTGLGILYYVLGAGMTLMPRVSQYFELLYRDLKRACWTFLQAVTTPFCPSSSTTAGGASPA